MTDWFAPKKMPSKYEYSFRRTSEAFYEALSSGLSQQAACAEVGCSISQFYEWKKKYPEFASKITDGLAAGKLAWERLGQNPDNPKFDAAIYKHRLAKVYGEAEDSTQQIAVFATAATEQSDSVADAINAIAQRSNHKDPFIEALESNAKPS